MSEFDVFLSHRSSDKPAVRELKRRLEGYGLRAWLDEDELRPGVPWLNLLEEAVRGSRSVAVCLTDDGLGPWEDQEMQAALRLAVKDKRPVIPVLLPGAPADVQLPLFLGSVTWVDLRGGLDEVGLDDLVWGITGKKPDSEGSDRSATETRAVSPQDSDSVSSPSQPAVLAGKEIAKDGDQPKERRWLFALTGGLLAAVLLSSGLWYLWYPRPPEGGTPPVIVSSSDEQKPRSPEARGNLQVNVNVDVAKVSIDGVVVGTARRSVPLLLNDIKAGQRRVLVQAEGWEPQEHRVTIEANQWIQVGFKLWQPPP